MGTHTKSCTAEQFDDYRRLFTRVEADWAKHTDIRGDRVPLLTFPKRVFEWDPKLGYSIDAAVRRRQTDREPILIVRISAFDPAYRASHPIDFCIPMAHDGASEQERVRWGLFGGAWSDTWVVRLLFFEREHHGWLAEVSDRIVVHEEGVDTASIVTLEERQVAPIRTFVEAAA